MEKVEKKRGPRSGRGNVSLEQGSGRNGELEQGGERCLGRAQISWGIEGNHLSPECLLLSQAALLCHQLLCKSSSFSGPPCRDTSCGYLGALELRSVCSGGKELQQEPQAITLLYRGNNYSYTQAITHLASGIVAGDIFFKSIKIWKILTLL